jgi:ABC-type dipeptide/oligopeptide/nickel transport system permease subunit
MTRNQLLLWASMGAFVGLVVGAINDNIPVWMLFGTALGLAMGYLQGKFDPETRE